VRVNSKYNMNTKICTKCGEEKPLTEFNFKNKAKGKRQS
jgi:ribosomal protein L40E